MSQVPFPGLVALSSLDYWRNSPLQLSVFDSKIDEVKSVNNLVNSEGELSFDIEATPDSFIDPQVMIRTTFKITKEDGTNMNAGEEVAIDANGAHCIFRDLVIKANGTRISQTNNTYPYIANLYNAYMTPEPARKMRDALELIYLSTPGQFDADQATNTGFGSRRTQSAASANVNVVWTPYNELSTQERLIPPMVKMEYIFTHAADVFRIMSLEQLATRSKKLQLVSMSLLVRRIQVAPDISTSILRRMAMDPAELPVRHVAMNQIQKNQGISDFDYYLQTSGRIPDCIFLFVFPSDRSATFNKSPFKFTPSIIDTLTVEADGKRYITDFDKYPKNAFLEVQKLLGYFQSPVTNGLVYPDFEGGYGILCCDLTRGNYGAANFNSLPRYGSVKLNIMLKTALVETMTFLMASISQEEIQVFSDFSVRASYN